MQLVGALNEGLVAPPEIPYGLLQSLLRSPCVIQQLRSSIAGSAPPSPDLREGSGTCWSAQLGPGSSRGISLVQVGGSGGSVERTDQLQGACLQRLLSTCEIS